MSSLQYCYVAFAVLGVYLSMLIARRRYRILLPSVVHTSIWLVTVFLIICELKGFLVSNQVGNAAYQKSSEFICYMMICSVAGFSLAHMFSDQQLSCSRISLIDSSVLDSILHKFRWVPYMCFFTGLTLFGYIVLSGGSLVSFGDYRMFAITVERTGYASIAQRISGHINILGTLYLMLLGYKFGYEGFRVSSFFKYVLLCSTINMAIGGRVWIMSSTIPVFVTYSLVRHFSGMPTSVKKRDNRKVLGIAACMVLLFGGLGYLRVTSGSSISDDATPIDKLLYLTDGSKMTNRILNAYPEGSYELEYGQSEFLSNFMGSRMMERYMRSISHDIGLSVTVKSIMPNIYFDYGMFWGCVMWGFVCFLIEMMALRLMMRTKLMALFIYGTLCILLMQTPVGNVFSLYMPLFEWLVLIYLFRKLIFKSVRGISPYL